MQTKQQLPIEHRRDESSSAQLLCKGVRVDDGFVHDRVEPRKHPTVGGIVGIAYDSNFDANSDPRSSDVSPIPLSEAITKQSSEALTGNFTELSVRHGAFSFGVSSNAPSESFGGLSGSNLNQERLQ